VSKETISRITDKVIEEMQAWQARPLDGAYAAAFIDAIMVKVRDRQVANRPVCAAIGVMRPAVPRRSGAICAQPRSGRLLMMPGVSCRRGCFSACQPEIVTQVCLEERVRVRP
jgi:hypothetical protein